MSMEYRTATVEDIDGPGVSGYAATWWEVDSYGSAIKPGAFRKTIKERGDRIPALWNHNPDWPIGKVTQLKEDKTGLFFKAEISERTQHGAETLELLRAGVPLGISFGFETLQRRTGQADDEFTFNTPLMFRKDSKLPPEEVEVKTEIRLWEVSPVTFPANEMTHFTEIRKSGSLDYIESLMAALTAGEELSAAQVAALDALTAAWQERQRPAPEQSTPPTASQQRRIDVTLALAKYQGWLGA